MVKTEGPMYGIYMNHDLLGSRVLDKSEIGPLEIMIEDNETVILSLMKEGLNYYYIDLLLPGATYQIETKENNESYLRELIPKIENVLKNGCHIKLKDKIAIIEGIS